MASDGYTLKEMMTEVRAQNQVALTQQAEILARLTSVDTHLATLNSKVATHELEIDRLRDEHTKAKAYAIAISSFVGFIVTAANVVYKYL